MFIYRIQHKTSKLGPYTHNKNKTKFYNKVLKKHNSPIDEYISIEVSLYKFFWKSIEDIHSFINGNYSSLYNDGFIIAKYITSNLELNYFSDNQIMVLTSDIDKLDFISIPVFSKQY